MDLILENWAQLILAVMVVAKVVVNLTPTEKDNKIFTYVDDFVNYLVKDKRK